MTIFGLLPPLKEEGDFGFSPNERCESSGLRNIKATGGTIFLEDAVHVEGLSHPSERLCSQVLTLKIPLHQAIGGGTHRYRVGGCQSFEARTNVGHFTQCQLFRTPLPTHVP